ncbi:DNA mismatch repair endonuclease MutL [Clostridium oceanicum]|uniref:DNA mismatch repair protein MutL n=1 Tax=Clostridium oceanicum TaxID=1543 RepID=A0ABN1JJ56_9CLOT
MSRINILNVETSNKIAAGEVIEKPFSVVKELVENSIDAGAKNISIEIIDGGQKSIKIIDDGQGIHPDDVEKAFMPHATSKIKGIDDVYKISTMGFRGEALASISSVAKVKLTTRVEEKDFGKEISINGGTLEYSKEAGCNVGTTIEVKDLFFNVPARLKFLKSFKSDSTYIKDIVNRLVLSHSDIAFTFINNGKQTIRSYGTSKLKDTIRCVYGKTVYENIINFEDHTDIASIYGYVGNSDISKKSRSKQSVFINKRYVKSKIIGAAVESAFKSFLTVNNYPFFILFIDIFPEYIDINVHPTKSEIKFRNERFIFKLVFDTVHEALKNSLKDNFDELFKKEEILDLNTLKKEKENSLEQINMSQRENNLNSLNKNVDSSNQIYKDDNTYKVKFPVDLNNFTSDKNDEKNQYELKEEFVNLMHNKGNAYKDYHCTAKEDKNHYNSKNENNSKNDLNNTINYNTPEKNLDYKNAGEEITQYTTLDNTNKENEVERQLEDSSIKIIGQFKNTYILIEKDDDLYIIDQHAAHEKVLFEKFMKEINEAAIVSQLLLTPDVLELSEEDYDIYLKNENIFKDTGFLIEGFGENTISIRQVPMILGKPSVEKLFLEILDNLKSMGSGKKTEVKYMSIATLACKSAVKAHDSLSIEEIKRLIRDMTNSDNPFTCPHGRPTLIKITLNELEKKFKRIQ